jgi:hypothetical protein
METKKLEKLHENQRDLTMNSGKQQNVVKNKTDEVMGKFSMKIFPLEKGEMEEQERDKNKHKNLQSKGRMSEVLVPDEPDKV